MRANRSTKTKSALVNPLTAAAGLWLAALCLAASPAQAQLMDPGPGRPAQPGVTTPQRPKKQREIPPDKAPDKASHLQLLLRVAEDGSVEVINATELPGDAVFSDAPVGNYVYEVAQGGKTVAVQSLVDPFEMRSFPGPAEGPTEGHHVHRAPSALLAIKVPHTTLADAQLDGLSIGLHRITTDRRLELIDAAELSKLKQSGELQLQLELRGPQLAPAIRLKGRKVEAQ
jgi:hypothetical protein